MSLPIAQQMQQLYNQFGELSGVTIELHKDLLAIRIDNDKASATVFLQGAQISHYQINNNKPILWCSSECDYRGGKSLRGGIPICWPWFGDLARNPEAVKKYIDSSSNVPAHGFLREHLWQLTTIENVSSEQTRLTLVANFAENEHPLWPYASQLRLTISIGAQLNLQLYFKNLSPQTVALSTALHSYFAVSDIDQVTVNGLEKLKYIDCLDEWHSHEQQGELIIDQEIDRIYNGTFQDIKLVDKNWNRVITVSNKGSNSAVLWNPWIEKAKKLSHFKNDAYKNMLCIETANIDQDYVELPSGNDHQLELTISEDKIIN